MKVFTTDFVKLYSIIRTPFRTYFESYIILIKDLLRSLSRRMSARAVLKFFHFGYIFLILKILILDNIVQNQGKN